VSSLSPPELKAFDYRALYQNLVWEPAVAFSLGGGRCARVDATALGRALAAWLTLSGEGSGLEQALQVFGLKPDELQPARETPEAVLDEVLLRPLRA